MLKKVFSGILSLAICSSLVTSLGTSSGTNSAKNEITKSDYELTGSNSLGKYLTQMSNQQQNLADIKADTALYSVSSLDFNAETGDISICSSQTTDCNINVIITDEISGETAYTKAFPVARGEYVATNEKLENVKLPEYFIVKAYLSDKKGKKISNEFVLNKYTKEMQEILTADIHDFPEAQVINFDESEETNFIVLNEDTVKAETTEDENILVSADYDSNVFVFENADPEIVSIEYGQYLYIQPNEDDIIAVAVDSVETDGNITTVTGLDQDIDDMFDFIKLEGQTENDMIDVDSTDADNEICYPEHTEKRFNYPSSQMLDFNIKSLSLPFPIKYDSTKELTLSLDGQKADKTLIGESFEPEKLAEIDKGFTGSITFKVSLNVYKKKNYTSAGLSFTTELKASAKFGVTSDHELINFPKDGVLDKFGKAQNQNAFKLLSRRYGLGSFKIPTGILGVFIDVQPALVINASGSIEISISYAHSVGFTYNSNDGFQPISNEDKDVCDASLNLSGEIFIGIELKPGLTLLSNKFLNVSFDITAGVVCSVEANVDMRDVADALEQQKSEDGHVVITNKSDDYYHSCALCFYGTVAIRLSFGISATIVGKDFQKDLDANIDIPIPCEWAEYCFGLTSLSPLDWHNDLRVAYADNPEEKVCPHRKYRVEFNISDEKQGYGLEGVEVTLGGLTQTTNYEGIAAFYCDNGNYSYTLKFGDNTKSGSFTVNNAKHIEEGEFAWTLSDDGEIKVDSVKTKSSEGEKKSVVTTTARTVKPIVTQTVCKEEEQIMESQQLGDNIWGFVYPDNSLYIYGDGAMFDDKSLSFKNAANIATVVFDETDPEHGKHITSIGNGLFKNCTNLKSITYEGSPNEGKVAVDLPPTITKIGDSAFENCRSLPFGDYKVHDGVTEVGAYAFGQCHQLTSCTLPQSVEKIGSGVFNKCMNLKKLSLPFAGATRDTEAGTLIYQLFNIEGAGLGGKFDSEYEDKFIHHGFCSMGPDDTNESIWAPNHVSAIPFELKEIEITGGDTIPENAFAYCSFLDKITLSDSIENIGVNAFFGCNNITELNLTDNIKTIGNGAFRECSKLKTLHISKNLETINGRTFAYCSSLDNIKIPGTVQGIGDTAFIGCVSLQHFEIGNGIKSIGTRAFQECHSIKKLVIPTSVEKIGHTIINKCESLEELSIPFIGSEPGLKKANFIYSLFDYEGANQGGKFPAQYEDRFIHHGYNRNDPDNDYGGCVAAIPFNFKRVELTGGDIVPEVGFAECSFLDEIILPEGIKSINYYDFWYCSGLKKLYIPESVTEISGSVFRGTNLTIYGKKGSYAEEYATKNNIKFVEYGSDDYKIEHITAEKAATGTTTVTTTVTTAKTTTTTTTTSKTSTTTAPKTSTTTSSTPAAVTVRGDANGDGELDMSDAVLIMQALANPNKYGVTGTSPTHITSAGFKSADTDGNGLTVNDALRIQKYLLGLIKSFD